MKLKSVTLYSAAVALLAVSSSALADVDVYGKANITLQNSDEAGESAVELKSNASRFGVKGEESLSEGLKAIYQFEWQVEPEAKGGDENFTARNQFIGLEGVFGTLKVGRHDTALKLAQGDFDLFNDLEGDIKNVVNGENRLQNYIGYTTPKFGDAFSISVNLFPGEDPAGDDNGIADGTSVSLNYEAGGAYAAVAMDSDVEAGVDTSRLVIGYKFGAATVHALYQQTDTETTDGDAVGASLSWKFGDNTFKLQHLTGDIHETGLADLESQSSIGLDRKLGKNTKVFGFYTTGDIAASDEGNDYFGIGLEHKF